GDVELRIKQEIMLGIGGFRALEALGLTPSVYHMNEGHSAFLALERIRRLMETHSLAFAEAREAASAGLIFTTHTAVPAGHDYFSPELMARYFSEYARSVGLAFRDFLALGRSKPDNESEPFCLTTLALRLARASNGVSRLHGQVSRRMWQALWPGLPEAEIPIGHISNGVHFRSWISAELDELYNRYLGQRWRDEPADQSLWARVQRIAAEELWRTHEKRRERLVSAARCRLREQLKRRGAPQAELEAADEVLHPDVLTIGFARRFATYKRATLLFRDPERLARLLNHPERPVQLIFAGQAHPHDEAGKELIREIISFCHRPEFRRRVVFLEGYDMALARSLVQGADVWLSTPRRPLEASGTSGMKAAANGVLNLSTLDGWWDEAWRGLNEDRGSRIEERESSALIYDVHIPTFYQRGEDKLPRRWIARMKSSIGSLCHYFNTHRMVREYTEQFYLPAAARQQQLAADGWARAKALAAWKAHLLSHWPQVRVEVINTAALAELEVGQSLQVRAQIRLGALTPADVSVELYAGRVDADGEIVEAQAWPMQPTAGNGAASQWFETAAVTCGKSGLHGFTVRVLPQHLNRGWQVYGVRHWFAGLAAGEFTSLGARAVGGIIQHGGTMLGSARYPEFKTEETRRIALTQLQQRDISALIVVGGNGSQAGAHALSQTGFPVIGLASTIDNDLYGAEITLGVDTALNIALEAIDRLKTTASSHQRACLVETMGRRCGYLALLAGIAGGAEAISIPEVETHPEVIAADIRQAYERGKPHAIVVVAEGAKYNAEALARYFKEHRERLGFDLRVTILGHVQRGGAPGVFDRLLGTRLGAAATEAMARAECGILLGWQHGEIIPTPLSEVVAKQKELDLSLFELANVLAQ
ncbi:MAG: alpha-glucan family phosphorylase, partial [Deltaproteobacteria bacterium]|nr:alpha-glucan family phosphorylase [Deltaproteobacteria bacterium]